MSLRPIRLPRRSAAAAGFAAAVLVAAGVWFATGQRLGRHAVRHPLPRPELGGRALGRRQPQ